MGLDVKRHGSALLTLAPYASRHADLHIALPEGLSDLARCALDLPPPQLLAYYRARTLRTDLDQPRHLTPVVLLG